MMLMLNIPATVGLVVLATPIVALIFERGRFTPGRHGGNCRGAGVLRAGPHRILSREARVAGLLRAAATAAFR